MSVELQTGKGHVDRIRKCTFVSIFVGLLNKIDFRVLAFKSFTLDYAQESNMLIKSNLESVYVSVLLSDVCVCVCVCACVRQTSGNSVLELNFKSCLLRVHGEKIHGVTFYSQLRQRQQIRSYFCK